MISYTMCAVKVRNAKLRNYLKQLFSNADTITDFRLIVILLGKTDADCVFVVNSRNYSITKIIKHVKYILVCKKCNHTLPNYLKVISGLTACDYDLAERIALKLGYVNKEHNAIKNGCSLSEYTLVADYDTLRERALGKKISIDRISEYCAGVENLISDWGKVVVSE